MPYIEYNAVSVQEKAYAEFLKQTRLSVSTMVNTFERKKNAFNTKNATRKKTGTLDMRRVANYRTSENLFSKKMIMPGQKNHKIMILIDWSGSISGIIQPIIYQAINVAQFCKKAGIKFQVMAFINNQYVEKANIEKSNNDMDMKNEFLMFEFLSDKMDQKEFSHGCKNLFLLGDQYIRQHRESYSEGYSDFVLNGTPLNQGLISAREMICAERAQFDSYSLVILTDGESERLSSKQKELYSYETPNYIDPRSNKMYDGNTVLGDSLRFDTRNETSFILELIKKHQVKNFVFHFFNHRPDRDFTSKATSNVDKQVYFLKDSHFKNVEEFFYVNANALFTIDSKDPSEMVEEDEEIEWDEFEDEADYEEAFKKVDKNSSVNSIQKEFTKVLSSEKIKRLVGSSLVTSICAAYN